MKRFVIFLIIITCSAASLAGQEKPLLNQELSRPGDPVYEIFVINQDGVPVFRDHEGDATVAAKTEMGELYFAKARAGERVLLGKYENDAFTKMLGWVKEEHVLSRQDPVTVGRAVELGAVPRSILSKSASAYSPANVLFLRVVTKPEARVEVARSPGMPAKLGGYRFTWFYVYDIARRYDPQEKTYHWYYLIAAQRTLFDTSFHSDTSSQAAKQRLLGWVRKDHFKEWCSNVVFEYNAAQEAVAKRYAPQRDGSSDPAQQAPAVLRSGPGEQYEIASHEPLEALWGRAFGLTPASPGAIPLARFDPYGFDPELPRFHVLEREGDWYRVATLGAPPSVGVGVSDIAQLMSKIKKVNNYLRQVDIVFVIDASPSMADEITAVGEWLKEMCNKFADRARSGKPITLTVGGRELPLDTTMNIQASVVLYQAIGARNDQLPFNTRVLLKGALLHNDRARVDQAFNQLAAQLTDKPIHEAIHDGVHRALTEKGLWRENTQTRMIIVIGDEAGDSGDREQKQVLAAMPLPPEIDTTANFDEAAFRRAHTSVYGIYTDFREDPRYFQQFQHNLRMLMEQPAAQTFHLRQFVRGDASSKQQLSDTLDRRIEEAHEQVARRSRLFAQQLIEQNGGATDVASLSASPVVFDLLAVQAAIKSAGASSLDELVKISDVAFTEGFVKLQQSNHNHPTFRKRVLLRRRDLDELRYVMEMFADSLDEVIRRRRTRTARDPATVLCAALLVAIAQLEGAQDEIASDEKLFQLAREKKIELRDKPDATLRSILNVKQSLPISAEGVLGMPAEELFQLSVEDLADFERDLRRKAKCLRSIIKGQTAPENYDAYDQHERKDKQWIFNHPQSGDEFYYVPIQYLP